MVKILQMVAFLSLLAGFAEAQPKARCNETVVAGRVAICFKDVPNYIRYCPTVTACNGKAAAILYRNYVNSFSVVLRDRGNADRIPACENPQFDYGNCSRSQCEAGQSQCSSAKVFRVINKGSGKSRRTIYCFRERGDSNFYKFVTRMTIKRTNSAESLVRVQLNQLNPRRALNRAKNDPDCKRSSI